MTWMMQPFRLPYFHGQELAQKQAIASEEDISTQIDLQRLEQKMAGYLIGFILFCSLIAGVIALKMLAH